MTTEARTYGRIAPATFQGWLVITRSACLKIIRGLALLTALWILMAVRGNAAIQWQVGGVAVSMVCLLIVFGFSARVWIFYIAGFVLFAQLRAHADEIGTPIQFSYPIDAEKAIFFGALPTIKLQSAFYSYARLSFLEGYTMGIYLSYFIVPHIFAVALWKWDRQRFRVYAPAFLITLYIGLIVCALAPTAPPWMASEAGLVPKIYQIVPDITDHLAPGTYQVGENSAGTNAVAAMPSLHAGVPWLMAIALWQYRRLRWAGVWYAASMSFAIVYLGEHYFVDALAGLATASFAWLAAHRALAWWDARKAAAVPARATRRSAAEGVTG